MSEDKVLRKVRAQLAKALEENRDQEAIDLLTDLRLAEPENARWPHKQGELLKQQGRDALAAQCFERAVSLYAKQGFIARAVAMAKTVVELDPARIGILERIDPQAAQLLRTQKRMSRQARVDLEDRPVEQLPLAPAPSREEQRKRRDPPPTPPPPPAVRAPLLASSQRLLGLSMPPRSAAKPPLVSQAPEPFAQRPPQPGAAKGQRVAPPPPPAAAMQVQSVTTPLTLDRLSLPPFIRRGPAAVSGETNANMKLDDLYGRAVRAVPMLSPNTAAPPNETAFSSMPPALRSPEAANDRALAQRLLHSMAPALMLEEDYEAEEALDGASELQLSEAELEPRRAVPVLESARPEPPTAATLADLPLFPLFAALPPPVLARIVAGSQLVELPHGAYVVRKDDDGDALYGIVEGSVNLTVPGQAFELTLAEGDVFGEGCLLEEAKSQLDVVVVGQLTALRIPRAVLLQGVEEHPPLAGLVLSLLTRRLLGNLLQVSPLFQDFDAAGKANLARLFEVRRVAAGTQLAVVGKKMDGLYISLTGTLIVEESGAASTWSAPPGSMLGQGSLLSHLPSSVAVSCAVDMIVLRLPAARFTGLAMEHPTVLARMADASTSEVVRVML